MMRAAIILYPIAWHELVTLLASQKLCVVSLRGKAYVKPSVRGGTCPDELRGSNKDAVE